MASGYCLWDVAGIRRWTRSTSTLVRSWVYVSGLSITCVSREPTSSGLTEFVPNICRCLAVQKMESQVNAQVLDVDIGMMRFVTSLGIGLGWIIDIAGRSPCLSILLFTALYHTVSPFLATSGSCFVVRDPMAESRNPSFELITS